MRGKRNSFYFNPFWPITVEHISYLSQVIEIWNLEFPVKGISDPALHCKTKVSHIPPIPIRDVSYLTLPGREYLNYSRPGKVW
jgi:hypothetical protein